MASHAADCWKRALIGAFLLCLAAEPLTIRSAVGQSESLPNDTELRAKWGLLAELAGRDFDACERRGSRCILFTVRWERPGRSLVIDGLQGPNRRTDTIRIDSTGILRLVRDGHGTGYWRDSAVTLGGDGSVLFVLSASSVEQWRLGRNGELEIESGRQSSSGGYRTQSRVRLSDVRIASAAARERVARFQARFPPALATDSVSALSSAPAPSQLGVAALPLASAASLRLRGSDRIALVIGVSTYGTLANLVNPANDARAVAVALRGVGFDVELLVDPDQRTMRQAVARLGERMSVAGPGTTGLFFFAGHGIQSQGTNYLIPSGAAIVREADLALEGVAADIVLMQMQEAGVSINILILDACRNMPLARGFRSIDRGLAQMDAPNGSFIAYSTAPGSVAADGDGEHSPFAVALVAELPRPGQSIESVFRNVRRSVLHATGGRQTPWDSSSLLDPFYFVAD